MNVAALLRTIIDIKTKVSCGNVANRSTLYFSPNRDNGLALNCMLNDEKKIAGISGRWMSLL
jgi:hypothetical protein